jgi:hypothetical protein
MDESLDGNSRQGFDPAFSFAALANVSRVNKSVYEKTTKY